MSVVVGIDPSLTCTGITVVDGTDITTSRSRTGTTDGSVREVRRRIRTSLQRTLLILPPRALFVIEGPALASKFGQPHERAGLFWFLVDQCLPRGEVVVVAPKTRAMYATGNGNGKKSEVVSAMRAAFPGVQIPDDNVADSLALAAMGCRSMGFPIDGDLTTKQLSAMAAPAWPTKKEQDA